MTKRLTLIAAALPLCLSLAACGSGSEPTPAETSAAAPADSGAVAPMDRPSTPASEATMPDAMATPGALMPDEEADVDRGNNGDRQPVQ